MAKVLIGIQARTNSTRFPGKINEVIGSKTMLATVVQTAKRSASYLQKGRYDIEVSVAVLVPENDPLSELHEIDSIPVIQGPEEDLVSRYQIAIKVYDPDLIVRLTSDCPLLTPPGITRHVNLAVVSGSDYCTNSHPEIRTVPDGVDVEVFSRRMFDYINAKATSDYDREHVGTMPKEGRVPRYFKTMHTQTGYYQGDLGKLSVDTKEDLKSVIKRFEEGNRREAKGRALGFVISRV